MVIALILIVASAYYNFILTGKQKSNVTEIKEAPKIAFNNGDYLFFGSYVNGVSYLECSKDKNKIYQFCESTVNPNACVQDILTIYVGYLYKTKQTNNLDLVLDIASEKGLTAEGKPISRDYAASFINDFMEPGKNREDFPDDLRIWKIGNENEIIKKYENNNLAVAYLENLLEYKKAVKLDDCKKIILGENRTIYDYLVRDACQLTFTFDKEAYCNALNEAVIV